MSLVQQENITIFDDDSIASKLLEYECRRSINLRVERKVKVLNADLSNIFKNYLEANKTVYPSPRPKANIFFHFTSEDFLKHGIHKQMKMIRIMFPYLSVFFAFEYMTQDEIKKRYELIKAPALRTGPATELETTVVNPSTKKKSDLDHNSL
jgi:hypothetical protein